jgi:hypothetical protein
VKSFNLTKPCEKCPFRKDIRAYLRKNRVMEIVSVLENGGSFPCHETVDYDDEGDPVIASKKWKFCAGATIMLEKAQDPEQAPANQMLRIMERIGTYDHRKLDMEAPVFDSFAAMVEAQEE